jgi:hypothetical protein
VQGLQTTVIGILVENADTLNGRKKNSGE